MHRHAVEYSTYPRALARVRVVVSRSGDFTAWRLIRDAFAVRERLGDPRVVPSFRCNPALDSVHMQTAMAVGKPSARVA